MKKHLHISSQILLFFYILFIFLNSTNGVEDYTFLKNNCSGDDNHVSDINIDFLLSNLTSKSATTKFFNFTTGETSNKIYGLFLCHSLYIDQVCQDCVTNAALNIRQLCPSSTDATIWYSSCMLRYSNRDIFSVNDVSVYYNILHGPKKFSQYNQRLFDTFNSLISRATTENSSSTSHMIKIYVNADLVASCYVDCTPDISQSECNQCLQTALGRLEFDGSQLGEVLQRSCRLSYVLSVSGSDSQGKVHYIAVGAISAIAIASLLKNIYVYLQSRKIIANPTRLDELESMEHLRFAFTAIKQVTGNFSEAYTLGRGGFGVVYLGTLPDGKAVAVKRLSNATSQGIKEFKTEACLTARLQHRNLVKLFGFCLEKHEMLLVYEFLPNKSLDRLLFDPQRRAYLKWETRYKIIVGLARGLSYLHEDSQPIIIHRDLKPSNILLDEDMNPKIADFGIAKPFKVDQTQGNTRRIAGTPGYMAPEYATTGRISVKTDIFSFGMIVLEMLSGLRNNGSYPDIQGDDLVNYVSIYEQ
ncbi:hypothetical protein RND81_06G127700 [Saponaria officinalis]|uniref:Uncharacterized protein n=1 Tax=Saponaria officinalis TaxID=3572 RepID=A0AAW1K657_SAPOF